MTYTKRKPNSPIVAGVVQLLDKDKIIYLRFLLALFASISCFIASRFFVLCERGVLRFSIPVLLFAIFDNYTLFTSFMWKLALTVFVYFGLYKNKQPPQRGGCLFFALRFTLC